LLAEDSVVEFGVGISFSGHDDYIGDRK